MTSPYRDYAFHQCYQMVANSWMVDTDRHNYPLQSFQSAGIKTQSMMIPQSVLCLLSLGVSTLPATSLAGNSGSISTARRLCVEAPDALTLLVLRRLGGGITLHKIQIPLKYLQRCAKCISSMENCPNVAKLGEHAASTRADNPTKSGFWTNFKVIYRLKTRNPKRFLR